MSTVVVQCGKCGEACGGGGGRHEDMMEDMVFNCCQMSNPIEVGNPVRWFWAHHQESGPAFLRLSSSSWPRSENLSVSTPRLNTTSCSSLHMCPNPPSPHHVDRRQAGRAGKSGNALPPSRGQWCHSQTPSCAIPSTTAVRRFERDETTLDMWHPRAPTQGLVGVGRIKASQYRTMRPLGTSVSSSPSRLWFHACRLCGRCSVVRIGLQCCGNARSVGASVGGRGSPHGLAEWHKSCPLGLEALHPVGRRGQDDTQETVMAD